MDNYVSTGYNVVGLTIQIKQGDVEKSLYMGGLNAGDFDELKAAIELSGEFAVTGFSLTMRDKKIKDGTFLVPAGTAENYRLSKIGFKRTVDIGGVETEMKTLYVPWMVPEDKTKKQAIATQLIGKTIAGAKITDVVQNLAGSMGA